MSIPSNRCASLSAILREGFQQADEGNPDMLLNLGLPLASIRQVQNLPAVQRHRVCDLNDSYLDTVFYQQRLEQIIVHVAREAVNEAELDKLILRKAPREMMYHLFGWTNNEFAACRARLGVSDKGGRSWKVSKDQQAAVVTAWHQHAGLSYAQRFLKVAQETQLNLKTIWPILRATWGIQKTGNPKRSAVSHSVTPQPQSVGP
jgi:hypothetical protein